VTLDPRLAPIAEASRTVSQTPGGDHGLNPSELRAHLDDRASATVKMLTSDGPPMASIVDHAFPVDGGENVLRVYSPHGGGPFPMHLYFHGGGFFANNPWILDSWCQRIADGAQCIVGSAQYRLAPEHKFPTAAEDAYAALLWFSEHGVELGGDPTRISVGGSSAGGNLAAVSALMARARGGPRLALQVLEIAVLDLTMSTPSYEEFAEGYVLTKRAMKQYADWYLGRPEDALNPLASPLLADDLSLLPPALIMTAECDPVRDEAEAYGWQLTAAGVDATVKRWDGMFHASQYMDKLIPDIAADYSATVVAALRRAYGDENTAVLVDRSSDT
jgi:acetyl esterase